MADPALLLHTDGLSNLDSRPPFPAPLARRALLRATGGAAIAAALAGLLLPAAAGLSPAQAALPFREVAEGIFVRFGVHEEVTAANCGAIANIGFIVGDASVAVVDTGTTHSQGLALRAAVAAVTDKPISHVIATHVHFDHCFGNSAFTDLPVRFIGHKNLPRALADRGAFYSELLSGICPDFAGTVVVPPSETVADMLDLDLGNRPLRLKAWPTAHTNTDLTVFDRRTGTLWTGDLLFVERLPTLDGSVNGWLQVLDDLLPADVKRVVPGHGPVSDGRAALAAERRYLETLRDGVRQALRDDLDIPATLDRLGNANPQHWKVFENVHGRNIVSAYTELEWE
ncbi:MAG: quinoprotein relay system zinc metallohydrolase 2 [Kiloniellaceae bacterium]